MGNRKYYTAFTVKQFLNLVDPFCKIIIHDSFEWETYEFENVGAFLMDEVGSAFRDCWVYDVDIKTFGVVRLTINDGFTDEAGNAYIIEEDSEYNTYVTLSE